MTDQTTQHSACQTEEIAAYLDGELDMAACAQFEQHIKECRSCAASLEDQKQVLRALDFSLNEPGLALPQDFARVVAINAGSDMSRVRRRSEHGFSLRVCAVLALLSFALLGGAAISETVFRPASLVFKHTIIIFDMVGRVLYDAGAGLTVISRAMGGHLLSESHPLILLSGLLLILLLALLLRLISHYHHTSIT